MIRLPDWCSGLAGRSVIHLTWGFNISLLDAVLLEKLSPVGCLRWCQSSTRCRVIGYKPIKWLAPLNGRCCDHHIKAIRLRISLSGKLKIIIIV